MPIDRGQIFLDIIAEMIAEAHDKIRSHNKRHAEIEVEIIVLERIAAGESIPQILATGNDAVLSAVGRIAAQATKGVESEALSRGCLPP